MLFDHGKLRAEQSGDVGDIGGRAERGDGPDLWEIGGDGDHCGSAEAVADEKLWRGVVLAEPPGGEPEVVEVGGEVGVGEIAFARTEAGEVEPEDADAVPIEFGRDAPGCDDVLGTCEAVSEQCKGAWRAGGKVEPAGERGAETAGEGHSLAGSCHLVRSVRRSVSVRVNPLERLNLPCPRPGDESPPVVSPTDRGDARERVGSRAP